VGRCDGGKVGGVTEATAGAGVAEGDYREPAAIAAIGFVGAAPAAHAPGTGALGTACAGVRAYIPARG